MAGAGEFDILAGLDDVGCDVNTVFVRDFRVIRSFQIRLSSPSPSAFLFYSSLRE